MNPIEIFIHIEGESDPRPIQVLEDAIVETLLKKVLAEHNEDYVLIFDEVLLEPLKRLPDHGIKHGHHIHAHRKVAITINGNTVLTHKGRNSVHHIRNIGKVPSDEIFSEYKNGDFSDLDNNEHVEICGGEIFASHTTSCGSS